MLFLSLGVVLFEWLVTVYVVFSSCTYYFPLNVFMSNNFPKYVYTRVIQYIMQLVYYNETNECYQFLLMIYHTGSISAFKYESVNSNLLRLTVARQPKTITFTTLAAIE